VPAHFVVPGLVPEPRTADCPAYEWDVADVNPPVYAWAALEVFAIDSARDIEFLSRVFDTLVVNFAWCINREDASVSNLLEGGFLGLDNIGPIDRFHLPPGATLKQSDVNGWMRSTPGPWALAAVRQGAGRRPEDRGPTWSPRSWNTLPAIPEAMESERMCDDTTAFSTTSSSLQKGP
jgi:hypothetical protein